MLVNPYGPDGRVLLETIPGTRIIADTLGIVGIVVTDPRNRARLWTIQTIYAPIQGRALGGVRTKLMDQKGFISFCNQRDLEILLDDASPGGYCPWLGSEYVEPGDKGWFGLCVDEQDMIDDLYDRELEARARYPEDVALPPGVSFDRRVHDGPKNDYIETVMLLWDMDLETCTGPDTRIETITNRWKRVECTPTLARRTLWVRL